MKDCKVVFLGQVNVGKSSIAHCLQSGQPGTTDQGPTIAAGYVGLEKDGVKLCMWDSSGSERFSSILPMYVRGAQIVILVYDVSDPGSIEKVKENRFRFIEEQPETQKSSWFVLGNKCDLSQRSIRAASSWWVEEMEEFSRQNEMKHFLVSAHSGTNLDELLKEMLKCAKNQEAVAVDPDVIKLGTSSSPPTTPVKSWFEPIKSHWQEKFGACF